MRLQWTKLAQAQFIDAIDYVDRENPEAAERQEAAVNHAVRILVDFPKMGRPGRNPKTRELVVGGTLYIVVYEVRGQSVRILAILHGARRWQSSFKN